jgi:hypothetical protein
MNLANTAFLKGKPLQIALTIIGMSGIVLSFVPFSSGVIPFTDVLLEWQMWDSLAVMAAPCIVLPAPISIAYATWLVTGRPPRWSVMAGCSLAALFAFGILANIAFTSSYDAADISLGLLFLIAFCGAAWLGTRGIEDNSQVRGLVAMQCVYAVPMTYFLVFLAGDYQIGAWLGLVTLFAYLGQISLALKRLAWSLVIIVPIACMNLLMLWLIGF